MSARETNKATTIAAIAAIMILEVAALVTGHNGTLLRVSLVLIAGLGGFALDRIIRKDNP